jgi:hypothetical protein
VKDRDPARKATSPELRGFRVKESRGTVVSDSLPFRPTDQLTSRLSPSRLALDSKESLRVACPEAGTADLSSPLWRITRSSPASPLTHRRAMSDGKVSSGPLMAKNFHQTRVQQNDLVVFANLAGIWRVVAPVNGSKADIRRIGGFDTRIVTAPVEILTVVRRAGSPGYSY